MSTITTINASDLITNSRTTINTNFSNLNTDKIETSYLDTDTAMAANSDVKIPSQKAVKTYIDTSGGANASETVRGIVEEATDAEVTAGTATGATGAKLVVTPAKLATRLAAFASPAYQNFTASGTWTKPANLKYVIVEVVGGGGGGGSRASGTPSAAAGGGGGGYSRKIVVAASLGATETVTIGAGGAAGTSGGSGSTGGTTSLGAHLSATGGTGGDNGSVGGAGGTGSSGDINSPGGTGHPAVASQTTPGNGGNTNYGAGGTNRGAGIAYGGGGSGATFSGGESAGGAGAAGLVIVTQYYI